MLAPQSSDVVHSCEVEGSTLTFHGTKLCFHGQCLSYDDIDSLRVASIDTYVNGAWVRGHRRIYLRAGPEHLDLDCSGTFPDRQDLNSSFESVISPIWEFVGNKMVSRYLTRLASGQPLVIGSVTLDRKGAHVDGSWKFLWWRAKQRFVPWTDVKIWCDEGTLFVGSKSDLRYRSELEFAKTDNVLVLDKLIREILQVGPENAFRAHET